MLISLQSPKLSKYFPFSNFFHFSTNFHTCTPYILLYFFQLTVNKLIKPKPESGNYMKHLLIIREELYVDGAKRVVDGRWLPQYSTIIKNKRICHDPDVWTAHRTATCRSSSTCMTLNVGWHTCYTALCLVSRYCKMVSTILWVPHSHWDSISNYCHATSAYY